MPDGVAAISISAARLLVPAAQTLPAPAGGDLVPLFALATALAPLDDPSDPPPRAGA